MSERNSTERAFDRLDALLLASGVVVQWQLHRTLDGYSIEAARDADNPIMQLVWCGAPARVPQPTPEAAVEDVLRALAEFSAGSLKASADRLREQQDRHKKLVALVNAFPATPKAG